MEAIVHAFCIYVFLLVLLRIAGKRTLGEMTSFDFVLVLIIAETTQQALIGDDFSLTGAMLLIGTLIGLDIALSLLKRKWPRVDRLVEGVPMVIVEHGRPLWDRMYKARVDESDVLSAARELQGLRNLDEIEYAVLERSGSISILPKRR
ncbi:MAG TPA: YetF domain-containing protein [Gammaproteobacteria bacterium]